MTQEMAKRIQQLYLDGNHVKDIASEIGVSLSTVYRYIRPVLRYERRNIIADELAKDYFSGNYSGDELCEKYHISKTTMYNYLAYAGYIMHSKPVRLTIKLTKAEAEHILLNIDELKFDDLVDKLRYVVDNCR